jgi:hypothetical protein
LEPNEKLNQALLVLKENNLIDDLEPDELVHIAQEVGSIDFKKVSKIIAYIRKRQIEKCSRVEAFKYAFPERCVVSNPEKGRFETERKVGEPLPDKTIELKAKRLENSNLYKSIMVVMNTSVYAVFALERIDVLQKALEKINDPTVNDRNKVEYMKVFLQETRKPEKAQELEVNFNLQQNNISIEQINNKLDDISSKLLNQSAGSIIKLLEENK